MRRTVKLTGPAAIPIIHAGLRRAAGIKLRGRGSAQFGLTLRCCQHYTSVTGTGSLSSFTTRTAIGSSFKRVMPFWVPSTSLGSKRVVTCKPNSVTFKVVLPPASDFSNTRTNRSSSSPAANSSTQLPTAVLISTWSGLDSRLGVPKMSSKVRFGPLGIAVGVGFLVDAGLG